MYEPDTSSFDIGLKPYRIILAIVIVGDGNVAEVATICGGIVVACLNGGVVHAVCSHIAIHQALKRSVLRGEACFDVVDAADAGQAASRGHRCASENEGLLHVC